MKVEVMPISVMTSRVFVYDTGDSQEAMIQRHEITRAVLENGLKGKNVMLTVDSNNPIVVAAAILAMVPLVGGLEVYDSDSEHFVRVLSRKRSKGE